MKHPANVLALAEQLKLGQKRRVDHDCGDGKTMVVSRNDRGVSYWCHRCHAKGWIPDERSLAERIQALSQAQEWDQVAADSLELPGPGKFDTWDWPDEALLWLFKAGFSRDEIKALGLYWNPRMQRVILPVRNMDGKVIYWQGRGFDKDRPKAINPTVNREGLVAQYGSGTDCVALTEDILSAAKVGGVEGASAWALLGTVLSYSTALSLAELGRPVLLMLDDDPAGRRGAAEASKILSLLGVWHKQVYFGKDPKLVPRSVIAFTIKEYLP